MVAQKTQIFRNFKEDPRHQAVAFEHVRAAHQTETAEDYVEMIDDLIHEQGEARVTDLAVRFGVSGATVNKMIARLGRDGLVENKPYRSIFLTEQGQKLAAACRKRHEIVFNFLRALGVSSAVAEIDSEGVEHHVSAETLKAFEKFIKARSQR